MNSRQIGTYGPNCTTGALTPHPPTALLFERPTLTNVTINLATVPSTIATLHNDTTGFVNGTANGLTCLLPPSSNFVGWPYGGGGINSDQTEDGHASSSKPTSTGGGAGTASSRPATQSGSAAGRLGTISGAGWMSLVVVLSFGLR